MNLIIGLILFGATILLCLYIAQQIMNDYKCKYGKIKISEKVNNDFIEKEILTNCSPTFNYIFGVPGSGKTTACCYYALKIQQMNKELIKSRRAVS